MDVPAVVRFFSLEEEAAAVSETMLEAPGPWRCLAAMETALKNEGELVNMPGTSEYGSIRTGAFCICISVKELRCSE